MNPSTYTFMSILFTLFISILLSFIIIPTVQSSTTTCLVSHYNYTSTLTLFTAGINQTGPYIFNVTSSSNSVQSNIGTFQYTSQNIFTTANTITGTVVGAFTMSSINNTNSSIYGTHTGTINTTTGGFIYNGIIEGGTGTYSGAVGSVYLNGTDHATPQNATYVTAIGSVLLIGTILVP